MNSDERQVRDAEILRLRNAGMRKADIARKFQIKPLRVRNILAKMGVPKAETGSGFSDPWDRDQNKLRMAIWKRAKEGARKALGK